MRLSLLLSGTGGLLARCSLSRIHPVRLVDWDGSLHTGLDGYLTASDLWPVCLLACVLTGGGLLMLLGSWLHGRQRARDARQA